MVILNIYVYRYLKLMLNQRSNRPKMMKKSAKMPIFLPVDPEGPKDRDLDPGPKTDWSIFDLTTLLTALAAGSIIYVVAFEILQRERSKIIRPKIAQFIAVVAGFAALMTVTLLSKTTLSDKYSRNRI